MNKKTIFITMISIFIFIIIAFILFESFSYLKLKNDCIKDNTSQNEYSLTINFDQSASDTEINKFAEITKNIAGVKNIEFKNKDESYQNLVEENSNNPEMLNQLNEIGYNPLSSSIKIYSNINNPNTFLDLEKEILDKTENYGLKINSHRDGKLELIQEQLIKVNNASLVKDLFKFIFENNKNNFFVDNYSFICNPNYKNSFLFSH